jgi:hypothetical protein
MGRWSMLAFLVVLIVGVSYGENVLPNEIRISPLLPCFGYARRLTNIGDLSLWLSYDKGKCAFITEFIPFVPVAIVTDAEWLMLSIRIGRPKGFAFEIGKGWAKVESEWGQGDQMGLFYRFSSKFQLGIRVLGCSFKGVGGVAYNFLVFSFNF